MRHTVPTKMHHAGALIVFICATLFSSHLAFAQFTQQGPKLVATDGAGHAQPASQGTSVSVSADGNTAIVGGRNDGFQGAGAAWVWSRSGGAWTQGTKLYGADAVGSASQGSSVAISADGNTAIVGGPNDNTAVGAAWVWTRNGAVWTQQSTKLVGSGAVGQAQGAIWSPQQGTSVAISADGDTAIVGAGYDNNSVGAAWVWTRNGGVWTQQGTKLVGSGSVGMSSQGWAVSLSADGNTAIIGGVGDNNGLGAAWVWTRSEGIWTQQSTKLVGSGAVGSAYQGSSASLSGDGNTAIIGGPLDNGHAGAAWVWTRSGGVWTQQSTKLIGSGAVPVVFEGHGAEQGVSVSLSADGSTAIVGGPSDAGGSVWVFAAANSVAPQRRRASRH